MPRASTLTARWWAVRWLAVAAAVLTLTASAAAEVVDVDVHPGGGVALLRADGSIAVKRPWPWSAGVAGPYGSGTMVAMAFNRTGKGAWLANRTGEVVPIGGARSFYTGDLPNGESVVDIEANPVGDGYWLLTSIGGIYTSAGGDRPPRFFGSVVGVWEAGKDGRPAGMAADPLGRGYWIVFENGRVLACDGFSPGAPQALCRGERLPHYGDLGTKLSSPEGAAVGIAADPLGRGYWIAGRDGGLFTFPDQSDEVKYLGNQRVTTTTGVAAAPWGGGYWMASESDARPFGQVDRPAVTPVPAATPTPGPKTRPPDPKLVFASRDRGRGRGRVVELLGIEAKRSWAGAVARLTCRRCRPRAVARPLRFKAGRGVLSAVIGRRGHGLRARRRARLFISGNKGTATFSYRYTVKKTKFGWTPLFTPKKVAAGRG